MSSPLQCASATSRLADPAEAGAQAARDALARVPDPKLVIVFAAAAYDQAAVLAGVRRVTGELPLAGGSSFAEVAPAGYQVGSVVVAVLGGGVRAAVVGEPFAGDPRRAAATAARAGRRAVANPHVTLLFCTAEKGGATDVVAGVQDALGADALLFGGGTASREEEGKWAAQDSRQFFGDRVLTGGVVLALVELTSPTARLVTAVSHGLQPISQPVTASGVDGRWVSELDGDNIFTFYEKYLGRRVEDVGPFIYTYPVLVKKPDEDQPLVRVPYDIDRAGGRIGFFPDGPAPGESVTLAHFSRGDIVRACRESAYDARVILGDAKPRLVLAVSCEARQMFLGPRVTSEARVLREVFGNDVPMAGLYSGAEIAPHSRRQACAQDGGHGGSHVMAQTFCVLAFGDSAAPALPAPAPARPAAPLSVEETLRQAHDEIRRLRTQIRENEELLDLRERVLLRINRENIDISRELRSVNARLSELVADHVLGREVAGYTIEAFVGAGGGGNVYRARQTATGRVVALKMLPKTLTAMQEKRFSREIKALARISDRHVVPYVEGSLERPLPFLAMGLVEGRTLELALKEAPSFPLPDAPRIARGIAQGLAAAHARKVLHRDLKPSNVILDAEGEAVLIDFGLARDEGPKQSTVTVEGEVLGTVPYFSPEHFQGRPTGTVSDVYQWGLLVHEMLTGTLPYPALEAWPGLMERFEKGVSMTRYDAPYDALARLAERCLNPSPRKRPSSAEALVAELT